VFHNWHASQCIVINSSAHHKAMVVSTAAKWNEKVSYGFLLTVHLKSLWNCARVTSWVLTWITHVLLTLARWFVHLSKDIVQVIECLKRGLY